MSRDKEYDKLNTDSEFTLEEILAEFGSGLHAKPPGPDLPWPEAKKRPPPPENVVLFPGPAPEADMPDPEEQEEQEDGGQPSDETPPSQTGQQPTAEKVLVFPEDDTPPLQAGLEHLKQKADTYAQQMFEQEGVEASDETLRFERLIPGVDEEDEPEDPPFRERKPRTPPPPPPDLPPRSWPSATDGA